MGLPTSTPPRDAHLLRAWRLTTGAELKSLCAALHQALTAHRAGTPHRQEEVAERLVLVATELATNAIRHGLPPTEVWLLRTADQFVLDVADHDQHTVPQPCPNRADGEGGLGLMLTRLLSVQVGWYTALDSKHIWASFPAAALA